VGGVVGTPTETAIVTFLPCASAGIVYEPLPRGNLTSVADLRRHREHHTARSGPLQPDAERRGSGPVVLCLDRERGLRGALDRRVGLHLVQEVAGGLVQVDLVEVIKQLRQCGTARYIRMSTQEVAARAADLRACDVALRALA
jgi:hypothetical protein